VSSRLHRRFSEEGTEEGRSITRSFSRTCAEISRLASNGRHFRSSFVSTLHTTGFGGLAVSWCSCCSFSVPPLPFPPQPGLQPSQAEDEDERREKMDSKSEGGAKSAAKGRKMIFSSFCYWTPKAGEERL
jgi:hypothetical protein